MYVDTYHNDLSRVEERPWITLHGRCISVCVHIDIGIKSRLPRWSLKVAQFVKSTDVTLPLFWKVWIRPTEWILLPFCLVRLNNLVEQGRNSDQRKFPVLRTGAYMWIGRYQTRHLMLHGAMRCRHRHRYRSPVLDPDFFSAGLDLEITVYVHEEKWATQHRGDYSVAYDPMSCSILVCMVWTVKAQVLQPSTNY